MKQVYLAGGMYGLTFEESDLWRRNITKELKNQCDSEIKIINPNRFYTYNEAHYISEKEVREFDLHKLRTSDLVIVNFNAPKSIGTAQELALAAEWRIPVLGLYESEEQIHPWLLECVSKLFGSMDTLVVYAVEYYLS